MVILCFDSLQLLGGKAPVIHAGDEPPFLHEADWVGRELVFFIRIAYTITMEDQLERHDVHQVVSHSI